MKAIEWGGKPGSMSRVYISGPSSPYGELTRRPASRWTFIGCLRVGPGVELEQLMVSAELSRNRGVNHMHENVHASFNVSFNGTMLNGTMFNDTNGTNEALNGTADDMLEEEAPKELIWIRRGGRMGKRHWEVLAKAGPKVTTPLTCTEMCEKKEYTFAALKGDDCYCLPARNRIGDMVDASMCNLACPEEYFNGTIRFCGGNDNGNVTHFSLYQQYDFIHQGSQGCYDPWRFVWYQTVAVERTMENGTAPGLEWYLHAVSIDTGEALFPYQLQLDQLVLGLQYDLDSSRIVGYAVPYWNDKPKATEWSPVVRIFHVNTTVTSNIVIQQVDVAFGVSLMPGAEVAVMGNSVTAMDARNDVYYVTVPSTDFATKIYGFDLGASTPGRIVLNREVQQKVILLEVNSKYSTLFGVLQEKMSMSQPSVFLFARLGRASWNTQYLSVHFIWEFEVTAMTQTGHHLIKSFSDYFLQIGATAVDHCSNSTFAVLKDLPDTQWPVLAASLDQHSPAENPELALTLPQGMRATWLANLDPLFPLLPAPKLHYARFTMEGRHVLLQFDDGIQGGIDPVDLDGDGLPNFNDFSRHQVGNFNCSEVFGPESPQRIGRGTSCRWNGSLLVMTMVEIDALGPKDLLVFRNETLAKYYNDTGEWSMFFYGKWEIGLPVPLRPPTLDLRYESPDSPAPGMVELCSTVSYDAGASYDHGNVPEWWWKLEDISCKSANKLSFSADFQQILKVRTKLIEVSRGQGKLRYPRGHSHLFFDKDDLEGGCTYQITLHLFSRWGFTIKRPITITKNVLRDNDIQYIPDCTFLCNVATCEPPSACDSRGRCVCAPSYYGAFCTGICPACDPRGAFGCDEGTVGTGRCVCRRGWTGTLCSEQVKWQAGPWTPCNGPCGRNPGFKNRTVTCMNLYTGSPADPSLCEVTPLAASEVCTTLPCGCSAPPPIPGGDVTATATACPAVASGTSCSAVCLPGFIQVGAFRCQDGEYIEMARCTMIGSDVSAIPALSVTLSLRNLDAAALADPSAYLKSSGLGDALKRSFSSLLGVPTADITVMAANAGQLGRRLMVTLEVVVTVRVPTTSSFANFETQLNSLALNSTALFHQLNKEIASSCIPGTPCLQTPMVALSPPVRSQLYVNENVTGGQTRPKADSSNQEADRNLVLGLALGFSIGSCLMAVIAIGVGSLWYRKARDNVIQVKPADMGPAVVLETDKPVLPASRPQVLQVQDDVPPGTVMEEQPARQRALSSEPNEKQGPRDGALAEAHPASPQAMVPAYTLDPRVFDGRGRPFSGFTCRDWLGGGIYEGQMVDGFREGEGRMQLPNNKLYLGQWLRGQFHGHGVLHALAGERSWIYNGQFRNGNRHGAGHCEWPHRGFWYCGEWEDGVQHGYNEYCTLPQGRQRGTGIETVTPPQAYIWLMKHGEKVEKLSPSRLVPTRDRLLRIDLEVTTLELFGEVSKSPGAGGMSMNSSSSSTMSSLPTTGVHGLRLGLRPGQLLNYRGLGESQLSSNVQLISQAWGIAIGMPDRWICGRWDALLLTRIFEDGALDRWNQDQRWEHGEAARTVVPNAIIWRVNGVAGNARKMAAELCAVEGRGRLSLEVRNPPCALSVEPLALEPPPPPPYDPPAVFSRRSQPDQASSSAAGMLEHHIRELPSGPNMPRPPLRKPGADSSTTGKVESAGEVVVHAPPMPSPPPRPPAEVPPLPDIPGITSPEV